MNIHLRNKLHWAHIFFALYYTPVIHVQTLCYVKIGPPPNLKNSNFLYLHSKIHSYITENMPRNPPPLSSKLKYSFHSPGEKHSGSPHDLPSPFSHKKASFSLIMLSHLPRNLIYTFTCRLCDMNEDVQGTCIATQIYRGWCNDR